MPRVAPFEALVYDTEVAGPLDALTARPYDVINEDGRRGYVARSPHNIARLDLADDPDAPLATRYDGVAATLAAWEREGIVRREASGYVAYEMELAPDRRPLRGLMCAVELEPWGGAILPHEDVMPGPVADRLALLRATGTHLSAIYGTVAGPIGELRGLLETACAAPATHDVTDQEGVRHRTWHVPPDVPVDRWVAEEHLLIADGHHRYTTALAYREERHAAEGRGPWDRVLTLIVDAGTQAVPVLPYHRVQHEGAVLEGGAEVAGRDELMAALDDRRVRIGSVRRSTDGSLSWRTHDLPGEPPAVRALHMLHLDAAAPGDDLTFTHEPNDAIAAVRTGSALAAYLLPPTTPERIMRVVETGGRLPRKSTFFWPKPRTGLVMMPLDRPSG